MESRIDSQVAMNREVHALAEQLLATGLDKLSPRECRVILGVAQRTQVSRDVNHAFAARQTFGDRLADRVAKFGGSWTFITLFLAALVAWTALNSLIMAGHGAAIDPYPYIFLNLILSMLAVRKDKGRIDSIFKLCEEVDQRLVNKRPLESLVKAGAFDSLADGPIPLRRARLFAAIDRAIEHGGRFQRNRQDEAKIVVRVLANQVDTAGCSK